MQETPAPRHLPILVAGVCPLLALIPNLATPSGRQLIPKSSCKLFSVGI
jgi:hypothetical protein